MFIYRSVSEKADPFRFSTTLHAILREGAAPVFLNPGDSISPAIQNVSPGTIISLSPGAYVESLHIWKSLVLLGLMADPRQSLFP
jgi:hypothetical protein